MSYSKLEVRFIGSGDVERKRVVSLPKRVQEYGDRYGYSSLIVTYYSDHLVIEGGGEDLFDRDINGDDNLETITSIVGYTWLV